MIHSSVVHRSVLENMVYVVERTVVKNSELAQPRIKDQIGGDPKYNLTWGAQE